MLLSYINIIYCDDYFSNIVKTVFSSNKIFDGDSECVKILEKYLEDLNYNKKWALYSKSNQIKIFRYHNKCIKLK